MFSSYKFQTNRTPSAKELQPFQEKSGSIAGLYRISTDINSGDDTRLISMAFPPCAEIISNNIRLIGKDEPVFLIVPLQLEHGSTEISDLFPRRQSTDFGRPRSSGRAMQSSRQD
jgi:hypothetical protein